MYFFSPFPAQVSPLCSIFVHTDRVRRQTLKVTRMDPLSVPLLLLLCAGSFSQVSGVESLVALYGETIVVPCNGGAAPPEGVMFIKWKYEKDDGAPGDLLIKQTHKDQAIDLTKGDYANRVSIDDKLSLLITDASLNDQKTFTCMMVSESNIREFPVSVVVHKKPSSLQIMDKAEVLKDKPTTVGTCVAAEANPAATITWKKNGTLLVPDGKVVGITPSVKLDPATGLSTTSSTLQYTATKEDVGALFSCLSTHELTSQELTLEPFPVHYPADKVSLQVLSKGPIIEGDNVTLKCHADSYPPTRSFYFHLKGQKVLVEGSDTFTLTSISREAAGEYKCSLTDNEKLEASQRLAVVYLDLSLSPSGKVVKKVGDTLPVKMEKSSSGNAKVSWTKNGKAAKEPQFSTLTFADTGVYVCEGSVAGLTQRQSFELVVEGKPVITSLTELLAEDGKHKVVTCEAEAVPQPTFQWSINSTNAKSSYINGRATQKITLLPKLNLTATCRVSNKLGDDVMTLNVSSVIMDEDNKKGSQEESDDQAKVIVGVIVGLLIAAALVGLIYWLYMKNSRQGTWKIVEKEEKESEEKNNATV